MNREQVKRLLYDRYIQPVRSEREDCVGVEIEIPLVNLNREMVDFTVVHRAAQRFMKRFGFTACGIDDEGNVYNAQEPQTGDVLSFDCSYNNLELSFGKETDLFAVQKRFQTYYAFLQKELAKDHHTLTGMGVNPYRKYNSGRFLPAPRYQMLCQYLKHPAQPPIPMYFHPYPEYATFASASQVQLDIAYEDLLPTIRAFQLLEPIKAVLFSNSVLLEDREDLLCARDMFWENSMHGYNPHNIGMFDCPLSDINDLLEYISTTSMYCTERDGRYIHFKPLPVTEYLEQEEITGQYFENGAYHDVTFRTRPEDVQYLRTYKFEDLTFRGTIEFRSVCCQPIRDSMTVAAFHLGLKAQVRELEQLLTNDHILYHHGYSATELRKWMVYRNWPSFIDRDGLKALIYQILDLCTEGLKARGKGEETLLAPLYQRAETLACPALTMLCQRERGVPLETILLDYAALK
ncbi:MAG: glutamylcysteine synthetase [Butyricicoccaceae bacterium]